MIKISPYNLNINFKSKTPRKEGGVGKTYTQSNGDTYKIYYKDGKINESYKNGELYKTYKYKGDVADDISYEFYDDDSTIPIKHLWHVDNKDIKSVVNHEDGTEHFFLRNDNNGIENEPKFFAHITLDSKNQIEKRNIVKFNDKQDVKFSSVEAAQEYFKEEYGIDAEFDSIFQAVIFKQAVDSFEPINYKNKGKRLFEGLRVKSDKDFFEGDTKGTYAVVYCDFLVDMPDELRNAKPSKQIKYIKEHPEIIDHEEPILFLNPLQEYDSISFYAQQKTKAHPYRFFSGTIAHELGHWLHIQNSPADYYISAVGKNGLLDKLTERKISRYAATEKAEFVAEYVAGRMEGNNYSKKADELYARCRGANIFE